MEETTAVDLASLVTAVTGAVDYSPVITGVATIAGAVALVLVTLKGASYMLGAIRGR